MSSELDQTETDLATFSAVEPPESAFHALVRAMGLLERVMQRYFAQFGISGSQWAVLRTLHRKMKCAKAAESRRQAEIAAGALANSNGESNAPANGQSNGQPTGNPNNHSNGNGHCCSTGMRITDLSERLLIRPPSVTGVVDRLERMGLVLRDPQLEDLRCKRVHLTAKGAELVEQVLRIHGKQMDLILAGLNPGDQAELHRLLGSLGRHWEKLLDQAPLTPAQAT